jgi:uncharacterized membrane protein (UPF0127 family)
MRHASLYALTFVAGIAAGCDDQTALRTTTMRIGKQTFTLEIADTDASQQKGLMERDSMPAGHGMIFFFPDEAEREFWMKNTRFPLDILFLNKSGTVVSIHQMQSYDEHLTSSDGPAQYAIELNLGAAKEAEVHVGDRLAVPAPTTQTSKNSQ